MKRNFVKTANAKKFLGALEALQARGAEEACLMVVDGEPGLGKTECIQWWAVQEGAVFLRAKKEWTPAWMMRELLGELRVTPAFSFEKMYAQALENLMGRARAAMHGDTPFAVVIDEVDHISGSARLLETIRDLSDMLEIPFILVGMGRVRHNLTRFPQIASRVGQYVEFEPAADADVRAMLNALCEVDVKDDLAEFLAKASDRRFREIKEGIASIERFGKRNAGAVGCVEMAGEVLLNDRRTGQAIMVRA